MVHVSDSAPVPLGSVVRHSGGPPHPLGPSTRPMITALLFEPASLAALRVRIEPAAIGNQDVVPQGQPRAGKVLQESR